MTFDWSRFIVRISVKADTGKIYHTLATKKGLESWFLRLADFTGLSGVKREPEELISAGDTYRWLWYGWPDDMEEKGEILEANGKDYLKFRFGNAGDCIVQIKNEAGERIVELMQENIPVDDEGKTQYHIGCKTGWTFYMANLKSIMEGGKDLRNRNTELKKMINS